MVVKSQNPTTGNLGETTMAKWRTTLGKIKRLKDNIRQAQDEMMRDDYKSGHR